MTAEHYQPATGLGDGPATDPDLIVVPDDVVEGEVLDGAAGAGEGAATDSAADDSAADDSAPNYGAANDSAPNYGAANDSAADELTGSSLAQDSVSDDHPAATEPSLVGAAAEAGLAGTIDGENSSAAAVTSGPVTTDNPAADLGQQWHDIQAMFVDDPRGSVEQAAAAADAAVSELTETLRRQQASLVGADGDPAGTEELREALRGYRIFSHAVADVSRQLRQPQP
jgi:hypothetical protein